MEPDPVVSVIRKSVVVPETPTKIRHFFLSSLDIFWRDIHYNRRVIFYKPSGKEWSTTVEILKKSLSVVLKHFYPWAGRLALGEDGRLIIDCNDLGVEFVEAAIDMPISELEEDVFQMKAWFDNLCQHVEFKNEKLFESPLLSVQVTRFSDDGLTVAIAQSHVVADGQSLWHFMVSWGECARGEKLSLEPVLDRTLLALPNPSPEKAHLELVLEEHQGEAEKTDSAVAEAINNRMTMDKVKANLPENETTVSSNVETTTECEKGREIALNERKEQLTAIENGEKKSVDKPTEPHGRNDEQEALVQHTYHISAEAIKQLRSEVEKATGRRFSSYEILGAHFWQRVTIARQRPAKESTFFSILTNNRSRLNPPLPPAYFGNTIWVVAVKAGVETISSESIGEIACRIHAGIAASNDERLRGNMHWLEVNDHQLAKEFKVVSGKYIHVASSPWFPAYKVDFGWGQPAAVRSAKVPGDGEMVQFGGRPGSSAGDVEICMPLPAQAMQNLLNDPLFLASSLPSHHVNST